MDRACRACGAPAETAAHVIQNCARTHGGRILRQGGLKDKGYDVTREEVYTHFIYPD